MSKALWFSDLHMKHSNLDLTKKLLDFVYDVVVKNDLHNIFITGDVFDTKAIIRSECLNQLRDFCKRCDKQATISILVGNHDMHSAKSIEFGHSLESLNDLRNTVVFDEPTTFTKKNSIVSKFVPYMEDPKELMRELKNETDVSFLFMHNGISGAMMNTKGVTDDFSISPKSYKKFKRVFCGHYHNYQVLDNIVYIGSPFSHSFAEANTKKYIGIIDFPSGNIELIEPGLRQHFDVVIRSKDMLKDGGSPTFNFGRDDLIRVFLGGTKEDNKKVAGKLDIKGNMKIIFKNEDRTEERIKIDPGEERASIIQKYIDKVNTTLDKRKLAEIGKQMV